MDVALRQALWDKVLAVAPDYGLVDVGYSSFQRTYGMKCVLSASDVVFGLFALLKSTPHAASVLGAKVAWKTEHESPVQHFYTAYDALDQ
jgi:hypothetical protein